MTTWTTQKTWNNEVVTDTNLNTYLRDDMNHLYENSLGQKISGLLGSADVNGTAGAGTSEEWDTTTTGLTWTPSDPTTVNSHTTIPGHLYFSTQTDATSRYGLKAWTPAGAFDARLGGVMIGCNTSVGATSSSAGLHIQNSDASVHALLIVRYTYNTGATNIDAYTYASSTYTQRGTSASVASGLRYYLRITRDASNNVSFYWSLNGLLWNFIATQALTFTVSHIGVKATANVTAGVQAAADWLRTSV